MNKIILILSCILFFSCKKVKEDVEHTKNKNLKTEVAQKTESVVETDTVFFQYQENKKHNQFAIINLINKKIGKDSSCTANFKIHFLKNNKTIYSENLTIKSYQEGSEWYGSYQLDTIAKNFVTLSFGYPACGYSQNNYLYNIAQNKVSKVYEWFSVGDGGWFSTINFTPINSDSFITVSENFWPDENSTSQDEIGIHEFSDSIHFIKKNDKWITERKTPKGKVFRTFKQKLDEYLNSQNQ